MIAKKIKGKLKKYLYPYLNDSYSQEGEDLLIKRYFEVENLHSGFYVDIGAHHPRRFSNTYLFYQNGWRGINVEPMPGSKRQFDTIRSRDINLEYAIGEKEGQEVLYIYNDYALNTINLYRKEELENFKNCNLVRTIEVNVIRLETLLDRYLPSNETFNLLSIDVEGHDFSVLKSNNWKKYKPKYILIECHNKDLRTSLKSSITLYLEAMGYNAVAKTFNTLVFSL